MNSEDDEHVEMFNHDYGGQSQKFWSIYVSEAEQYDTNITETWKADMESMLIFAGLFSAVVTAFTIESYKLLKQDSTDLTNALLTQILAVQIAMASPNNTSIHPITTTTPSTAFVPKASAIALNFLWFFSLVCSRAAAFCVILVQQWVRDYLQRVQRNTQPLRRARERAFLFNGMQKYRMDLLVENIPLLLHTSLFLFFIGLCVYLFSTLTLPSVAVTGAVVPPLLFCLLIYGLATISPLLDPSSPFETPFSSMLWKIQQRTGARLTKYYLGNSQQPIPASASLAIAREQLALNPLSPDDSHSRDAQAFLWAYRRVNDDSELQRFAECIPGFLKSRDGQRVWSLVSGRSAESQPVLEALEDQITRLLSSTFWAKYMDLTLINQRKNACSEALYTISRYQPTQIPLNRPSRHVVDLEYVFIEGFVTGLGSTDLGKFICTLSLMVRRRFLKHWSTKHLPNNLRELSDKADQALRDVQRIQETLEDVIKGMPSSQSWNSTDIGELLQVYFAVLHTKSLDILKYTNFIQTIWPSDLASGSRALSWYHKFPFNPCVIEYSDPMPNLGATPSEIHLYPHQILAFLRTMHVLAPLKDISSSTLSSGTRPTNNWFPTTKRIANVLGEDNALCREIMPISFLLDQLVDPSFTPHPKVKLDDHETSAMMHFPFFPSRRAPPMFAPQGPFTTLTCILEDIQDGGETITLVEILVRSRPSEAKTLDWSVIFDTLFHVLHTPLWNRPMLSEGSQVLFILLLHGFLAWECDETRSTPFPLKRYMPDLISMLRRNLTHKLSLQVAEQIFGLTPIDVTMETRAQVILDHIEQRQARNSERQRRVSIEPHEVAKNTEVIYPMLS